MRGETYGDVREMSADAPLTQPEKVGDDEILLAWPTDGVSTLNATLTLLPSLRSGDDDHLQQLLPLIHLTYGDGG